MKKSNLSTKKYIEDNKYNLDKNYNYEIQNMNLNYGLISKLKKIIMLILEFFYFFKLVISNINELKILSSYNKTKKNLPCIVMGNGPSQGLIDLDFIKKFKEIGGELIVINYFHYNKIFETITPDYLVISDPHTLSKNLKEKYKLINQKNSSLINYLEKNPQIKIFCPLEHKKRIRDILKFNKIIGFVDQEIRFLKLTDLRLPRGYSSNTILKAMALCNYLGYSKKYLIGFDNTMLKNIFIDKENKITTKIDYAYREDEYFRQNLPSQLLNLISDFRILYDDLYTIFFKFKFINLDQYSLVDCFIKVKKPKDIFYK